MTKDGEAELQERQAWLNNLTRYVKLDKIIEFGCGSGFVLEILSRKFGQSIIVGIDKSRERLEKVVEKKLKNVIPLQADIAKNIFPQKTFDTALFVGSLHEVFSYQGKRKVEDSLRMAYQVLKDKGILIIQDFLKPASKLVEMGFKNEKTRRKFQRFARDFQPRKIRFRKTEDGVKLDLADAIEFISKYSFKGKEWKEEMGETHFFFTLEEYKKVAKKNGFIIKGLKKLSRGEKWRVEIRKDVDFKFEPEYARIQLVLIKRET